MEISTDDKSGDDLFFEADEKISQNKYTEARDLLLEAIKIDPQHGRAFNHLGWLYTLKFQDYKTADKYYRLALNLSPEYAPLYYNYGKLLMRLEKYDHVIDLLQSSLKVEGIDKSDIYEMLGGAYEHLGKYREAVDSYSKALKHSIHSEQSKYLKGSIERCRDKGDIPVETTSSQDIKSEDINNKSAEQLFFEADKAEDNGDYTRAISLLEQAIGKNPQFIKAYSLLGWIYERRYTDFKKSEEYYKKGMELDINKYPVIIGNYVYLLIRLNKLDEVESLVKRGLEVEGSSKADLYDYLGRALERKGSYDAAIKAYLKGAKYTLDTGEFDNFKEKITRCKDKVEFLKDLKKIKKWWFLSVLEVALILWALYIIIWK